MRSGFLLRVAGGCALLALFFVPLDAGFAGRLPAEFNAFAHVAAFMLLAMLLQRLPALRRQAAARRIAMVLIGAVLIGALIELLQPLTGRSMRLGDVLLDLAGALLGVALSLPRSLGDRSRPWLIVGAFAFTLTLLWAPSARLADRFLAHWTFPALADFELPFEARRWSKGVRDDAVARSGRHALRFELAAGRYDHTLFAGPFGDWSDFDRLELSLFNPDPEPMLLTVSIGDAAHYERGGRADDRLDRRFELVKGWNDLVVPLREIREAPAERGADLAAIRRFVLFTVRLNRPRTLYLDRVRLQ
mgnify:CR=1 FL=1